MSATVTPLFLMPTKVPSQQQLMLMPLTQVNVFSTEKFLLNPACILSSPVKRMECLIDSCIATVTTQLSISLKCMWDMCSTEWH
jgi:hypothetical protein